MNTNVSHAVTVTLVVWGGVAPLIGITFGHILTRSSQREQWLLDRRKEEWRELLTALAESLRYMMKMHQGSVLTADEHKSIIEVQANTFRVIRDRIFIAADIASLNIENRWSKACNDHYRSLDAAAFGEVYDMVRCEIVDRATVKH